MKRILTLALAMLLCASFAAQARAQGETASGAALLREGRGKDVVESVHSTLQDAFDSITRNGAVVTLLRDVTESAAYGGDYSATLYFNGHTLTGLGEAALSHTGRGALTLGEPGGTGGGITGSRYALYISSTRDTLLQSGVYAADAADGTAIYNAGGSLSIRCAGGEVTAQGAVALRDDSARLLQITGGCYQGAGGGFAVQKTRGSLNLTGGPTILGSGGGLLLEPGPDPADVTPPRSSALLMEAGARIAATAPGGTALQVDADALWDVTLGKGGTVKGDIALALTAGTMTVTGPEIRLEGEIAASGSLCLQGGLYSQPPEPSLYAPGLFAVKAEAGWYALASEPPVPAPSPAAESPAPGEQPAEPSPTPVLSPAPAERTGARTSGPTPDAAADPTLPTGGVGVPKTGSTAWAGSGLMLAAAGLFGLLLRQRRK